MRLIFIILLCFSGGAAAKDTSLGVKTGEAAPGIDVVDISGAKFALTQAVKKGPTVLVFYRGGWCPYCNSQLRKLKRQVYPAAKKVNGEIVAISVDKLQEGTKTMKSQDLPFTIVSDPKMEIISSYNLKYKVPEELVRKYKVEYKIDLEASSGEKHHTIAVPGVFVVGRDMKITYAYINKDYKIRAPNQDIVAAVEETAKQWKKTGE